MGLMAFDLSLCLSLSLSLSLSFSHPLSRGSIFGETVGRSKNVLESIAIDQKSIISHFGITKTPQIPSKTLKSKENDKSLLDFPLKEIQPFFSGRVAPSCINLNFYKNVKSKIYFLNFYIGLVFVIRLFP